MLLSSCSARVHPTGVGTAGATGAFAPAMPKPRGRKYLFAPAIICKVYLVAENPKYTFVPDPTEGVYKLFPRLPSSG